MVFECISQDLDAYDLGGPITWQVLGDETLVTHYDIYLAPCC